MAEARLARRRLLAALASTGALAALPAHAAAPVARDFRPSVFNSFFLGGFECSTHRRGDGKRLDVIAATGHDRLALQDYRQLREHDIDSARDGVRWHLVEAQPGRHDWSSLRPMLAAAKAARLQVAWDLMHFGWPDHLDVFSGAFVEHFARYAGAFARLHLEETGTPPIVCPINEISFLSHGGGEMGWINPGTRGRGAEMRRNLVRASIAAAAAVREAAPGATLLAIEPLVHIAAGPGHDPEEIAALNEQQVLALDLLDGQAAPGLGGGPQVFDLVGMNYYWNHQWIHNGPRIGGDDPRYRPLFRLMQDIEARYGRNIFLSETGIEGPERPAWLRYIGRAMRDAVLAGVRMEGICIYPIMSHPGWDDDRYAPNGLFEMGPHDGLRRPVHQPLAEELARQQDLFAALFAAA
ncbi:hypothetical protein [Falsiroseomonas sp. E2-1-a20]|uniref:hypothetical protein n=1 Tax=Falsiroseomonas sp. E2-1-a20 TaxID=3239300 RepID=UPI003F2C9A8C